MRLIVAVEALVSITEKSPLANTPLLPKMTSATPKFAPELIPKIDGPAKGLLKAVCTSKPAAVNAASQSSAVIVCGMRDSSTWKR